jgi:TraB/PrgY/gumN family
LGYVIDTTIIWIVQMKCLLIVLLLSFSSAFARAQGDSDNSVWAWKLSGGARDVYFLAELHSFTGDFGFKVDHRLGESIVRRSSELWVEPINLSSESTHGYPMLSTRLGSNTWDAVVNSTHDALKKIAVNASAERRLALERSYLASMNNSCPVEAHGLITMLGILTSRASQPLKYLGHNGLRRHIMGKDSEVVKKFVYVEDDRPAHRTWYKSCVDAETDAFINDALESLRSKKFAIDDVQNVFLSHTSDIDQLERVMTNGVGFKLLNKCSVYPRNSDWFPKIKQAIETPGGPVTFLFGAGHFTGAQGLISMLRAAGYTDIKRIYSLE